MQHSPGARVSCIPGLAGIGLEHKPENNKRLFCLRSLSYANVRSCHISQQKYVPVTSFLSGCPSLHFHLHFLF